MNNQENERRRFLKAAMAGGAVAAVGMPQRAPAQVPEAKPAVAPDTAPPGYIYLPPKAATEFHITPMDEAQWRYGRLAPLGKPRRESEWRVRRRQRQNYAYGVWPGGIFALRSA
jgi:hypothetical protein